MKKSYVKKLWYLIFLWLQSGVRALATCKIYLFLDVYAKMGFKKPCITIMSSFFFCSFFIGVCRRKRGKDEKGWKCVCVLGDPFGYICCDKWGYQCVFACVRYMNFFQYGKRFVSINLSRGYIIQGCLFLYMSLWRLKNCWNVDK